MGGERGVSRQQVEAKTVPVTLYVLKCIALTTTLQKLVGCTVINKLQRKDINLENTFRKFIFLGSYVMFLKSEEYQEYNAIS